MPMFGALKLTGLFLSLFYIQAIYSSERLTCLGIIGDHLYELCREMDCRGVDQVQFLMWDELGAIKGVLYGRFDQIGRSV